MTASNERDDDGRPLLVMPRTAPTRSDREMPAISCATCVFFQQPTGPGNRGQCRRMPPTPTPWVLPEGKIEIRALFPQTLPQHWCGEHATAED